MTPIIMIDPDRTKPYQDTFLKITCVAQKNYLPAREIFSEFHPACGIKNAPNTAVSGRFGLSLEV